MTAVACLLLRWAAWLPYARVPIYPATGDARLEVDRTAHAVGSPVAGRVTLSRLELSRIVRAGDVLIEIDGTALLLERREREARVAGISAELEALRRQ